MTRQLISFFPVLGALACLMACSGASYENGRSRDDLPPHITSIYLKDISPLGEDFHNPPQMSASSINKDDPSADDSLIAKIVRSNIAIDLTHKGYRVIDDPLQDHDVDMTVFLFYQPDDWPMAHRSIHLWAEMSKPQGGAIFHVETMRENWFGSMGDFMGFAGDEMLVDAAHQIVDLSIDRMPPVQDRFQ